MPGKESQFFKGWEAPKRTPADEKELSQKEKGADFTTKIEGLFGFLETMAGELRKSGAPVDNECRVDMKAFQGKYEQEEIDQDNREIARIRESIRLKDSEKRGKSLSEQEFEKINKRRAGNRLEVLKTAIFHKNLGSEFIVVRSSLYDDIKGGVDNLILEKKTGNLVCAFDEVASSKKAGEKGRQIYEKKKARILKKNTEGGSSLKYGLKMDRKKSGMSFNLGKVENIPIFYLALSPETVQQGIRNFRASIAEQSDFEKSLFNSFLRSMRSQANILINSAGKSLTPELKQSLLVFKDSLERISQEKKT